jgi:hypothetical protein
VTTKAAPAKKSTKTAAVTPPAPKTTLNPQAKWPFPTGSKP